MRPARLMITTLLLTVAADLMRGQVIADDSGEPNHSSQIDDDAASGSNISTDPVKADRVEDHPGAGTYGGTGESGHAVGSSGLISIAVPIRQFELNSDRSLYPTPVGHDLSAPTVLQSGRDDAETFSGRSGLKLTGEHSVQSPPQSLLSSGMASESGAACIVCRRPRTDYTQTIVVGAAMLFVAFRSRKKSGPHETGDSSGNSGTGS